MIDLFDGQEYQNYLPREENKAMGRELGKYEPELQLAGKKRRAYLFRHPEIPVLLHHGFVPVEISTDGFEPCKLERDNYRLVPAETAKDIVVVRYSDNKQPKKYRDFYVDGARGNEIIKVLGYYDNNVWSTTGITLKKTATGWMPATWTSTTTNERKEIDDKLTIKSTKPRSMRRSTKSSFASTRGPA